jgi:hypothetical protein
MNEIGIYVRIQRDGKWVNLDITELTYEELREFFESKKSEPELNEWFDHFLEMCFRTMHSRYYDCKSLHEKRERLIDLAWFTLQKVKMER